MKLYYHPRSPYSQKTLIAFYEKRVSFTPVIVNPIDAADRVRLSEVTPLAKVPVLILDDGAKIPESSIIIEYLDTYFTSGTRLIPEDRDLARQTRFHDRIADLYINNSITKIFFDSQKPAEKRDPEGVAAAHQRLDTMYTGLDAHLAKRTWIMGEIFTLADCALIPPLGFSRMLHPFDRWKNLSAYAARAFERASYVKIQQELAPYLAATGT